ncbi:MAG: SMC family ATPase [Rothia sp. (in: high G+C Gram-positive bacteria)]|nr:SMC family ATPase [Rothia sp. (in: high G+C Gram-positive bacteria)]
MRIHRLKLTAYGPFPNTIDIDFEDLNEAGIFLLNGPTGSGKSSILDAICFALYGTTSMARPELKSHFAPADREPKVELDCTIGTTRLHIERSPKWSRPKKRGSGFIQEQAKVLVQRQNPQNLDEWETKSHRNDEAGQYITELIGLNREQFTQVMLLPQGEFARFLTSKSQDREELLKRLFPTVDYEHVQAQLSEQAKESQAKVQSILQKVQRLEENFSATIDRSGIDTLEQVLERPLEKYHLEPHSEIIHEAATSEDPLTDDAEPQSELSLTQSMESEVERNSRALDLLTMLNQRIDTELQTQREQLQQAQQVAEDWKAYDDLRAQQQQLEQQRAQHLDIVASLERARAAALLRPFDQTAQRAARTAHTAREAFEQSVTDLEESWSVSSPLHVENEEQQDDVPAETAGTAVSEQIRNFISVAKTQQLTEQACDDLVQSLETLIRQNEAQLQTGVRADTLRKQLQQLEQQLTKLTQRQQQTEEQLQRTQWEHQEKQNLLQTFADVEVQGAALDTDLRTTQEVLLKSQSCARKVSELSAAQEKASVSEIHRQTASVTADRLQKMRYQQAAQFLSQELETGQPCPVCGSVKHPLPAQFSLDERVVEESDIETALAQRSEAEASASADRTRVNQLKAEILALEESGAQPEPTAHEAMQRVKKLVAEHQQKKLLKAQTQQQLENLSQRLKTLEQELQNTTIDHTTLRSQYSTLEAQLTELEDQLPQDFDAESLKELNQQYQYFQTSINTIKRRFQTHQDAEEHAQQSAQELAYAVAQSRFDTIEQARESDVLEKQREEWGSAVKKYEHWQSSVTAQLESNRMVHIAQLQRDQEQPVTADELEEWAHRVAAVEEDRELIIRSETRLQQAREELQHIQNEYQQALAHSEQIIHQTNMHQRLADIAAGNTTDNHLSMSLTTYVLAAQLEEVARASTLHFEKMTHGRYQLQYTDEKIARGKSGLGITIFDTWHSTHRVPATLSGGETFMASLALALGLADVVQQRNGGIEIDTLFVDEGFGTLDDFTLEEVMSTLDGLREGGRVIGLISHVAEMKNRIPLHITLTTSPEGSQIV